MRNGTFSVIDLFAGAGLFSAAFAREGFEILQAVEIDPAAIETYRRNVGDHVQQMDVRVGTPACSCDVIIAGPPCQGFSTLGKRDEDDPRNALSLEVLRWAEAAKPAIVVIENVAAFLDHPVWNELRRGFEKLGFGVSAHVLNAYDYGVPQLRARSFTIASRAKLPEIAPVEGRFVRTVREAFVGLSSIPDGHNNHFAPTPSAIALSRMRVIPPGGDKRDVLEHAPDLAPPSWHSTRYQATDAWGRMLWDRPCNTLRTALQNASKGRYIHPDQNRVISLREACRLHSIWDDWSFAGYSTHIARQIGNSVPPRLGQSVASAVRAVLEGSSELAPSPAKAADLATAA